VNHRHNGRRCVRLTAEPPADSAAARELAAKKARDIAGQLGFSSEYSIEVK
jgi:hypothetical protein